MKNRNWITLLIAGALMVSLSSVQAAEGRPPDIHLLIDVRDTANAALVRLEFPRNGQQQIELTLSDWAGLTELATGINSLQATVDGKALALENVGDGKWQIRPLQGERIALQYRIATNQRTRTGDSRDHYRTIVLPDLFHAVGHNTLILPTHLPGEWQVSMQWRLPKGWQTASSFSALTEQASFRVSPELLASSLFMAGKLRVLKREVHQQPVYLAVHGEQWQFSDAAMADLVQRVLTVEREFMNDYDFPHYLVSVLGVGPSIDNGYSLNGTRLYRNFALFLNPNAGLKPGSMVAKALEALLMHETFHEWNGGQLSSDPKLKEGELYWFTEGLTNFYTRELLWQADMRSEAETLQSINDLLRSYYTSPVRDQGNAAIVEQFWSSSAIQELPYQRGDLLGLYLDLRIRQLSDGKQSLDDLFRALLQASREGTHLTADRFFSELANWLPAEERAELRHFVEQGGELSLLAAALPRCLSQQQTTFHEWQAGFDLDASLAAKVVKGLQPGSAAERAGLRNGDQLTGWSIRWNDTSTPIELSLADRKEAVSYLPHGRAMTAPQWLASSSDCVLLAQ